MAPRLEKNALEWAAFALGAALTLGVTGFLTYDALAGGGGEPVLRVTLGAPRPEAGQAVVPVRVRNEGGTAGADVHVEVCREESCAEVAFPFVPRGAYGEGTVGLDPGPGPLRARVTSYQTP
jgi:uncharacterized protein (TIGR02588 family)